jgi:Ni/Fe-hydrogenase subunit HybB-like protein
MTIATEIDNTREDPTRRADLVLGAPTYAKVTEKVAALAEKPKPPLAWYVAFGVSSLLAAMLFALVLYLVLKGIGVWGVNVPTGWGFAIVNFVFWIGIGHAGTLISAILFLFRQRWRTSINRAAEAMTVIAVTCAGVFPAIHIGRVWLVYYLFPYPNQHSMWPNFRSPLLWDVFAVSTYATVSLLFWYMGMIPDLATLRDRAKTTIRRIAYGIFALGWRGSSRHWHVYEKAYLLLAALATPLVLSVHSVVSFDFAVSQVPGWHSTIFPPYFVAGAIFSGFAMVLTLMIPARQWFGLKDFITMRHLDNMAKVVLLTGSMVGGTYLIEFFIAWYGGNPYEQFAFLNRFMGPYWWAGAVMLACNLVLPQLLWIKRLRRSIGALFVISILVNVGMWFERFVIVLTLTRGQLPGGWGAYAPTWVDIGMLVGSFGLFFALFLLFCRYLPIVAMAEVKSILPHGDHGTGGKEVER